MIARRVVTIALLALAGLGAYASTAGAAEPIEGRWMFPNGDLADFFPTGPGQFTYQYVGDSNKLGNCDPAKTPGNPKLTGSGLHYTGTISFYNTSSCEYVGEGSMDVTIDPGRQKMQIAFKQPKSQVCCSSTQDLTRVAEPPLVFAGTLPEIVNRGLVQIRQGQSAANRAKKNRRAARYRAIRSSALATQTKVRNYRVTSPTEATLRTCALKWLKYVAAVAAKHSATAVTAGANQLARTCLSGFGQLFAGGEPGTVVSHKPTAHPKKPPAPDSRADNYYGVGTDPNLIPRIDFAYDPIRSDRIDHIRNINISIRVACLGKVFYLVLGPEYFPALNVAPGSGIFGTGSGPVTYATVAGDQPGQIYELEVYLAGIIDGTYGAHGTLKVQRRQGSSSTFCGSSNFKRWYATRK
jgi:hypothetical protein